MVSQLHTNTNHAELYLDHPPECDKDTPTDDQFKEAGAFLEFKRGIDKLKRANDQAHTMEFPVAKYYANKCTFEVSKRPGLKKVFLHWEDVPRLSLGFQDILYGHNIGFEMNGLYLPNTVDESTDFATVAEKGRFNFHLLLYGFH